MLSSHDVPHLGPLRLPEQAPEHALLRRLGLAASLIVAVTVLQWLGRGGLRDNVHPGQAVGFVDVLYFTIVSLTTVGYGDITPVTDQARLVNALVMTPVRVFLWVLFLGTAYELTMLRLRFREDRQMKELHDRLRDHVIVCGYGVKGRAIVDELLAHGQPREQIVAIDESEEAVAMATKDGLVALRGDASREAILRAANIEDAHAVLVAPNRDDASVLICLTVRSLTPHVHLVASAREEENIKLLYGAGADLVVSPSVSGGRLMGAAVRQQAVPQFLEDLLRFGQGLALSERIVRPDEAGMTAARLPGLGDALILGAARGRERFAFHQLSGLRLQPGDVVVYLPAGTGTAAQPELSDERDMPSSR
ncbi:MAG: potassium channel family protein [Chloroflexota bacterium]|nr:potassium channel family protein [Chloroflexota bacterium]